MDPSNKNIPVSFLELTEEDVILSDENLKDEAHYLLAYADKDNSDIYLKFSSRLAMYDFARSLMHKALFDKGDLTELYPLSSENKLHIVNEARLSLDSSKLFIFYPHPKESSF